MLKSHQSKLGKLGGSLC